MQPSEEPNDINLETASTGIPPVDPEARPTGRLKRRTLSAIAVSTDPATPPDDTTTTGFENFDVGAYLSGLGVPATMDTLLDNFEKTFLKVDEIGGAQARICSNSSLEALGISHFPKSRMSSYMHSLDNLNLIIKLCETSSVKVADLLSSQPDSAPGKALQELNNLALKLCEEFKAMAATQESNLSKTPANPSAQPPAGTAAPAKKAARKAPATSPVGGAAPTSTPALATNFENFDVEDFLNKLNFNTAANNQVLRARIEDAMVQIEIIEIALSRLCRQISITTLNLNKIIPQSDFNIYLDEIIGSSRNFLLALPTTLDAATSDNINATVFSIIKIARGTSSRYLTEFARLNPVTPAVVTGGAGTGRTPGAPAVDATVLERQMNSDWGILESYIRNEDYTYEEKLAELESFVAKISAGRYGDPAEDTLKAKLLGYSTLMRDCKSVEGNFTSEAILTANRDALKIAEKIKADALSAKKREDLAKIIDRAEKFRLAFDKRVRDAKKIEVIRNLPPDRSGSVKTKSETITISNPLVFEAIYGNIRKQVNDLISEDFFTAQETRISSLEKEDKALTEAKGRIDVAIGACMTAITTATSNINTILPGGGAITKKAWEKFNNGYKGQLLLLQNNINTRVNSIRAEVVANNKASTHAIAKMAELAEKVNGFNGDYMYASDTSMGIKMSPIHDKYKLVEGVVDANGNVKSFATPFVSGAKINVPALDINAAVPTSPTPPGSASPYRAMGALDNSLDGVWRRASPLQRTGGIFAAAAVAAVLVAAALSVKKDDKDPGKGNKPVATAPADATAAPRNSNAPNAHSTGSANNSNSRGAEASDRSAAVARMSSAQVLGRIEIRDGESFTFAGEDMLNPGNYNQIKRAGSSSNPSHEERLKYYTLAHLISDMSSAPADNEYSVSRIRLLRYATSEASDFKPKNITAASSKAALTHWALDTSREAEKFVIYFYDKNITIYLRGDADWRKAIEDTVRGHMVSGGSGELTDPEMYELFNSTKIQKQWKTIEDAIRKGSLADIMKNKEEYFVKNK